MKRIVCLICILLLVFPAAAGAVPRPKNGVQKEYYPNGHPRLEVWFKNEKLVRKRAFYRNGQLMQDFVYKNGKPWVRKDFYENGRLKSLWTKKSGVTVYYHQDGTKTEFKNSFTTYRDLPQSLIFK